MYTIENVENLFGASSARYLQGKHRGGTNNSKGNTYENIFAIYQVALLSKDVIESQKNIFFSSQILAYVDDLIIEYETDILLRHFQLKNSSNVSWGSGEKSICDDFEKQYILNNSYSKKSHLELVVSCDKLRRKLDSCIPINIKSYSQVIYFCHEESLSKILNKDENFRNAIKYLCASDNPEPDKLECVATVLLGAWVASDKSKASVMDIIMKAQQSSPCYIRSFNLQLKLDPEVENILKNIEGFTYKISKGFLEWEFEEGLNEGILPYSIDSQQFTNFQKKLKQKQPIYFDDLEVFLI